MQNRIWQPAGTPTVNRATRSTVTLEAVEITLTEAWDGVSRNVRIANLGNAGSISLVPFKEAPVEDCVITVSFSIGNLQAMRYKLWEGVGEVLNVPLYTGQRLGPLAVFELWTVEGVTEIDLADLVIPTSQRFQLDVECVQRGACNVDRSVSLAWLNQPCTNCGLIVDTPYFEYTAADQVDTPYFEYEEGYVSPPTFTPVETYFADGTTLEVELACATPAADIHYTLNGDVPTSGSALFTPGTPIELTETTTIKAIAVKAGLADSTVSEQTYTEVTSHTAGYFVFGSPLTPFASEDDFLGAGGLEYDMSAYLPLSSGLPGILFGMGYGAGYGGGPGYFGFCAVPFNAPPPVNFLYDYNVPPDVSIPMLTNAQGLTHQDANGFWFYYLFINGDLFRVYVTSEFTPEISATYNEAVLIQF